VAKDNDVVLAIDGLTVGPSVKLSHDIESLINKKEITQKKQVVLWTIQLAYQLLSKINRKLSSATVLSIAHR
jgi:hypothetical protein